MNVYKLVVSLIVFGFSAHALGMEGTQKVASKINVLTAEFPTDERFSSKSLEKYQQLQWVTAQDLDITYIENKDDFTSFDFEKYGFQPVSNIVSSEFLSADGMRNDEEINQDTETVSQQLRAQLETWGKQNGIEFDLVIMSGGCVKRNLSKDSSLTKNYSFAHIDFPEGHTEATIKAFGGDELWAQFAPFDIAKVVNIWMPLNNQANVNTLAIMNKETVKKYRVQPTEAYFGRDVKFNSVYLEESQPLEDNWFAFKIAKGDAIIFDSERTPHCAVDILRSDFSDEARRSIEYRAFFLQAKK